MRTNQQLLIPGSTVINHAWKPKAQGVAVLEFIAGIYQLSSLVKEIDLLAKHCAIGKLPEELAGLDAKLGAAYIELQSAGRAIDLEGDVFRIIATPIAQRIEGIQRVIREQDGGHYLRAVAAATSPSFSVELDTFADKIRPGRPKGTGGMRPANAVLGAVADKLKAQHPGESWQGLARLATVELETAIENTPEWEAALLLKSKTYNGQGNYLKTQWQRYSEKKSSQ